MRMTDKAMMLNIGSRERKKKTTKRCREWLSVTPDRVRSQFAERRRSSLADERQQASITSMTLTTLMSIVHRCTTNDANRVTTSAISYDVDMFGDVVFAFVNIETDDVIARRRIGATRFDKLVVATIGKHIDIVSVFIVIVDKSVDAAVHHLHGRRSRRRIRSVVSRLNSTDSSVNANKRSNDALSTAKAGTWRHACGVQRRWRAVRSARRRSPSRFVSTTRDA
jgi:hypothetical protein